MKFPWIGPWDSRTNWCEGYWYSSTYKVVRLSDITSKTDKKCFFWVFWLFLTYVGQPHNHLSWAVPMAFASINSANPRTNPWEFHEKILRIGGAEKWAFFEAAILNFLGRPFWIFFCPISVKNPARLYEVKKNSALWMVFAESWKISCSNFYAHDCSDFSEILEMEQNAPCFSPHILWIWIILPIHHDFLGPRGLQETHMDTLKPQYTNTY